MLWAGIAQLVQQLAMGCHTAAGMGQIHILAE